ncbi:MAG: hypothetical protein EA397_07815 [Deltaproteobacteria bacterium]|nr:MAG: hypothetical protein EA397_07815 [Deltaproteobacteria bacterium]
MADVFLAIDPQVGAHRPIVIKRILPHLAQDESFIHMFLQEARIAMAIDHPHVVRIHRLSEHNGLPYLVMDYIDGLTFRQLSRAAAEAGRLLPLAVTLDLMMQACTGAHAVHQTEVGEHREIVHRDLCPHNLIVDRSGHVVLLDFGIAKAARGMDTTRSGVLKGKTSYLAPEQVRAEAVDRRTDVWALSVVTWELLAGRPMFEGLSDHEIMQRITRGQLPDLRSYRPDLPDSLIATVHHSLQLPPDKRFPNAHALREALANTASRYDIVPSQIRTADYLMRLEAGEAPTSTTEPTPVRPRQPARRTALNLTVIMLSAFIAVGVFLVSVLVGALLLAPTAPQGEAVRIVFAPILPPDELSAELEPLRLDLERELERPVGFFVAPNYRTTGALLVREKADFAVLPPLLFLRVEARMGDDLEVVAMTEIDKSMVVDGLIIAGVDVPWESPQSLQGRSLCLTDPTSATGYGLPRQWMADHGIDPDKDLASIHMSGDHHQVISDVANGICELGAVYSGALKSAVDAEVPAHLTRQVAVTGHTPNESICAGPHTDPALVEALRSVLLAWDPLDRHGRRNLGSRHRLSGFVPFDSESYDPLRRALKMIDEADEPVEIPEDL